MRTAVVFLFALLCAAFANSESLYAITITVTSTADPTESGKTTLRDALAAASDGDTIDFSVTGTITVTAFVQLEVDHDITISGPGADVLAVSGNILGGRVFHIATGKTVIISGLTITGGQATKAGDNSGGGILNEGSMLTITNSTVSGNMAVAFGGGIANQGGSTLTIANSTVSGNHATWGGGIFNAGSATLSNSTLSDNFSVEEGGGLRNEGSATIDHSTVSGNTVTGDLPSYSGGGISNHSLSAPPTLVVKDSTVSGNRVIGGSCGGILNRGLATVGNSTLSDNYSAYLGDVCSSLSLTLGNTILDTGASGSGLSIFVESGAVSSLGYNLSTDNGFGYLDQPTDQINTVPNLGPLQDNGGPTFTHALLAGSPAIDQGKNLTASATDQRGLARTFDAPAITNAAGGDGTDIGAFEVHPPSVCPEPQGYWKNNPAAWPAADLMLGDTAYSQNELLVILNTPVGRGKNADASLILAYQLIAAKLNIANGVDGTLVASIIADADNLLDGCTLACDIRTNSVTGQQMVHDAAMLEAFNKGLLTEGCTQ